MKKIGLAGFGFIGSFLFERLIDNNEIEVAAIWEPEQQKTASLDHKLICRDLNELGERPLDLIVEVAHPDVVKNLWPLIKSGADLMIASLTSLSDSEFYKQMECEAKQRDQKIYLPHGAILGLDGLRDGRIMLETVTITTTKHPKNLGMDDRKIEEPILVFKGSTFDACQKFPRNVNVHAAVALAGLGFKETQSIVIADPNTKTMQHCIEVKGRGLNWKLEIESFSAGTVSGTYTPESLYQSVVNILQKNAGFRIV